MRFILSFVLSLAFILLPSDLTFAADRKLVKAVNTIVRSMKYLVEESVNNDPVNIEEAGRQTDSYIKLTQKAISDGKYKVPENIKGDVNSLLKLVKQIVSQGRRAIDSGTSALTLTESFQFAEDQAQALYELLLKPNDVACVYDVEFRILGYIGLEPVARTLINVTCNQHFDTIEATVLPGSTAGQIASIVRYYKFGGNPDIDGPNGGSGSCFNQATSAGCFAFGAKAGGTAMIALGIYDNPGVELPLRVVVKRRGKEIDFDDVMPSSN